MTGKKPGRPKGNPLPHRLTVRMNDETLEKLDKYCAEQKIERSEGIRRGILKLDDEK